MEGLRAAIGIAAEATEGFSEVEALEWTEEFLGRKGLSVPANLRTWINDAKGLTAPPPTPRLKGEAVDASAVPWAWEGFVMASAFTLLVAPPKVGKSALMVGMIGAWWHGEASYLGHAFHGQCPPVFIVGTDQPEGDWVTLLRREGLLGPGNTLGGPIEALWHTGAPLHLTPQGIATLAEKAAQHPGALFLVDSYHACVSPLGIDEATSAFDGPARALTEALGPHKATIVMIHHANKSVSGGNAINASRGSNSLPAAASLTILMSWLKTPAEGQTQSDYRVMVKTTGRAKGSSMLIELEDDGWMSHGNSEAAMQAEALADAALDLQGRQADAYDYIVDRYELAHAAVSGVELQDHLNLPQNKTKRVTDGLLKKGLIIKAGVTEPIGAGRPSQLFTPATPLPGNGVLSVSNGGNPEEVCLTRTQLRDKTSLIPITARSWGGVSSEEGGVKTPAQAETLAITGESLNPVKGMSVEKFQGGHWQNGWVIKDASNLDKVEIEKLGNRLMKFVSQRWLVDIRPCGGSPWPTAATPAQAEEPEAAQGLLDTADSEDWI